MAWWGGSVVYTLIYSANLNISQYIIIGKISIMQGLEPQTLCTLHSCSYHCTTSVDTHSDFGWHKTVGHEIHLITSPAGWPGCRTSQWRRARRATHAGHDVAGPGLD